MLVAALFASVVVAGGADEIICRDFTAAHTNETWREPGGVLPFPYLVPAGPYEQEWDWDALFLGVATLPWGSQPYFEGSMMNFLAATNLTDGSVTGCLTRELPTVCSSDPTMTDSLVHAKPLIVQGAWLSAVADGGDPWVFRRFAPAMRALLAYWDQTPRVDAATGLRVWHDQMESGADNLVLSQCPNARSAECWTEAQAFTLASPDLMVFLQREHSAFALFLDSWASESHRRGEASAAEAYSSEAQLYRANAQNLKRILNEQLWREDLGFHAAFNVSSRRYIESRTYQIALPLWAGLVNRSQAAAITATLRASDMLSQWGLRSVSSADSRYSNADVIVPYSNWRGPMWVNANALACYGLADYGETDLALDIAHRVLRTLADDLRESGQWHEAYSTDDGSALAAPGFLSWNTLSANLASNLNEARNPLRLAPQSGGGDVVAVLV
eukprot:TRINITY_DN34247_c0_g2_i1.p1 TRINITY_DN34247_c0_g2~~TRINITY_DN34247_c0_g2_i1.p1  ORF type:complete len:444 (-),score=56.21 TRINITY_DN34247_c0_g2_i1:108-1439(-)